MVPALILSRALRSGSIVVLLTVSAVWSAADAYAARSSADLQLLHDVWTFKDGAPENIYALAQTTDGFLWLGTPKGLFRFDGTRFEPFRSSFGTHLASTSITGLYAPASGGLWIGYQFGGTSFVDHAMVTNYGVEATGSRTVYGFAQERGGAVWAASAGGLMRFDGSRWQAIGAEWNVPVGAIYQVAVDPEGTVWILAPGVLLKLDASRNRFVVVERGVKRTSLPQNSDGIIWTRSPLSTGAQAGRPDEGGLHPATGDEFGFLTDRVGAVWADKGNQTVRQLPRDDGSAGSRRVETYDFLNFAGSLHVDREGNIWFGCSDGLHRFYYTPLIRIEIPATQGDFALAPDGQGAVWVGGTGVGEFGRGLWGQLYRASREKVDKEARLTDEVSCAYRAPDGTLWVGGGRTLWHLANGRLMRISVPTTSVSRRIGVQSITMDRSGTLWVSLPPDGVYRLREGTWTRFSGTPGFPAGPALSGFTDTRGRVWFGFTGNRIGVLDGERVQQFAVDDGVAIGNVTAISGRGPTIWFGGEQGLLQFDGKAFRRVLVQDDEAARGISGIVEMPSGDLWMNGLSGIVHISAEEVARAVRDAAYRAAFQRFGRHEGLPGFAAQLRPLPTAADDGQGRLWFAVTNGVVSIDPTNAAKQTSSPPVTIQSIAADGTEYPPRFPLVLPAGTSSLHVSYDAVSLTNPEAIHFRYRLSDIDNSWRDVGAVRDVTYRNLRPGSYDLSVAASDSNGVWTDAQTVIEFSIRPTFYQTRWFLTLAWVAAFATICLLYLLRTRHLTRTVHARLAAQMSERERIARDLHDTLLQEVTGLLLRFHAVSMRVAPEELVGQMLNEALDRGDEMLVQARDTVRGLRTEAGANEDLSLAFTEYAKRVVVGDAAPAFRVTTAGSPWRMRSIIRDEIVHIGQEAINNAFTHGRATRIDVELHFSKGSLVVVVRDNGCGIPPAILQDGRREGHWGLIGMRERAEKVGGRLTIRSQPDLGTVIELKMPAGIAAAREPDSSSLRSWWRATVRRLRSDRARQEADRL